MPNEIQKAPAKAQGLAKAPSEELKLAANKLANYYIADVANANEAVGVPMDDHSKRCGVNLFMHMVSEYGAPAVQQIPSAQIVNALQFVTINGLDVFSGQVFLDVRKNRDGSIKSIKATPQGSAYEIMVKRFGIDVKTVHPARIVHEGDEFRLPQFEGLKMTDVFFKPTLEGLDGKAIAVYYLIEKIDGTTDFAVATREGVAKNLMAHILNATLRAPDINRDELMKQMEGKTLDELLNDESLARFIAPTYRSPATKESMIIAKMKKNALMHYTRDLGAKSYAVNAKFDTDDAMFDKSAIVLDGDEEERKQSAPIQMFRFEKPREEEPSNEPEPAEAKPEPAEAEEVEEEEAVPTDEPEYDPFDVEGL